MRTEGPESQNVEDRRGSGGGGAGWGGRRVLGGGMGVVLLAIVAMFFGVDPRIVMGLLGDTGEAVAVPAQTSTHGAPATDEMSRFVSVVLADTEKTWNALFTARGAHYRDPTLVLFKGQTPTACGMGQAAMGPFYCPTDQKVYIDLAFYAMLRDRFRAPGDFAQAYVIAHEVGHHVQNLLGIMAKMEQMRPRLSEQENNALSVRVELQADCFAGVWAHHASNRQLLDAGDIEEAMTAAAAIGDDTIQRRTQGTIVPESFTHGTSQQRMHWLKAGMESGRLDACDTFANRSV